MKALCDKLVVSPLFLRRGKARFIRLFKRNVRVIQEKAYPDKPGLRYAEAQGYTTRRNKPEAVPLGWLPAIALPPARMKLRILLFCRTGERHCDSANSQDRLPVTAFR